MAETPPIQVPVHVGPFTAASEFVQIGDKVLNRAHILGLMNKGKHSTWIITQARDIPVDVPLSKAAASLEVTYVAVPA